MSRRAASFVVGFALAVLVGAGLWWWLSGRAGGRSGAGALAGGGQAGETVGFNLYFPTAGGDLRAERRELRVAASPKDRIRRIVEALLAGPQTPGLVRTMPEGVTVGSVQLGENGIAYVDLRWSESPDPPAGGSTEEIQRVYSVVDSIALNLPEVKGVALLWNGVQRDTFSGHLDLSHPLTPDRGPAAAATASK